MKRAALLIILVFSLPVAAQEVTDLTSQQVLNAISIFGFEPLPKRGKGMSSLIVSFADVSKDVEISIDPGIYG